VEIRFTQAARRHRIGRASVRWVMATNTPTATTTNTGDVAWQWIGSDERGLDLDVIAVEVNGAEDATPFLLVIHVMPNYQKGTSS
jgi:hypothetical protein